MPSNGRRNNESKQKETFRMSLRLGSGNERGKGASTPPFNVIKESQQLTISACWLDFSSFAGRNLFIFLVNKATCSLENLSNLLHKVLKKCLKMSLEVDWEPHRWWSQMRFKVFVFLSFASFLFPISNLIHPKSFFFFPTPSFTSPHHSTTFQSLMEIPSRGEWAATVNANLPPLNSQRELPAGCEKQIKSRLKSAEECHEQFVKSFQIEFYLIRLPSRIFCRLDAWRCWTPTHEAFLCMEKGSSSVLSAGLPIFVVGAFSHVSGKISVFVLLFDYTPRRIKPCTSGTTSEMCRFRISN